MKITHALAICLLAFSAGFDLPPAEAQSTDASKWTRPNIGFSRPPASEVPATGITGQVTANQIDSIDGSQVSGTVAQAANALNAQQAQTAAAAQSLDPNATIDPSKLNLQPCTGGKVLTVKAGSGLECVLAGSGSAGFANKQYFNMNNQTWSVPDDVFQIRLTAAAGNTVQWRQMYGQTGSSPNYSQVAASPVCDWENGCTGFYICPAGYGPQGHHLNPVCTSSSPTSFSPTYGCLTPSQNSSPGQSGSKTFGVTPGQLFRAVLSSISMPVSVAAPHNQCPENYDVVYSVMADVPEEAEVPDVWHDKRNGEAAGEQSVTSAMIVEW